MGKFLNKFKRGTENIGKEISNLEDNGKFDKEEKINKKRFHHKETEEDSIYNEHEEDYGYEEDSEHRDNHNEHDVGIQQSQKSESFHHFILENKFAEIERDIRGLKDVLNKETQQWELKRKDEHCFTDEEAENIVRLVQSHLSTDIKLGWIPVDKFGETMNALYEEIEFVFERIAEYQYGRYNNKDGTLNYEKQGRMKALNHKIFLDLWVRVQANYSRSISGTENKLTHESVKGQESLQSTDRKEDNYRSYS